MKRILVGTLSLAALLAAGPVFSQRADTDQETGQETGTEQESDGGISGMMQTLEGMAPDMMGEMREMIEDLDPSQIRDVHRLMRDIDVERMEEIHATMQELDLERMQRLQEQMDRIEPLLSMVEDIDPAQARLLHRTGMIADTTGT